MNKLLVSTLAFAMLVGSVATACAVTQKEYESVIEQRDALYKQIIEADMVPCVDIIEKENSVNAEYAVADNGEYVLINEYKWNTDWFHSWGIVIKNTTGKTADFQAQVILYDADNNIIGVKNPSVDTIADGYEGFISFSDENEFDHLSYTVSASPSSYYNEVQSFVDVKVSKAGDKAIIMATNTGSVAAQFVEYNLLFLKDGKVVSEDWGFLTDNDSEIKPGKVEMREAKCYEEFDDVEIFFSGRY